MIKKTLFMLFAVLAISTFACKEKNETGSAQINFTATYGDQPLVMFAESYAYPDGSFKPHLLNFFLSNISLIKDDNSLVPLSDIELFEFKDQVDANAAMSGVSSPQYDIPAAHYVGVQFGLGVAPQMNATDPASYTPPHPLTENYWSWALGYVFYKFEGILDTDGDGEYEQGLTYHVGHDDLYKTLIFDKSITVSDQQNVRLEFDIDLAKILQSTDGSRIDMIANPIDHTTNPEVYQKIAANIATAFTLK